MSDRFVVGDVVGWRSQAQGREKVKAGVVAEVVRAGQRPSRDRFLRLYKGAGVGFSRDHESYVIVVGRNEIPYWPRVMHLRRLNGSAA